MQSEHLRKNITEFINWHLLYCWTIKSMALINNYF